MLSWERNPAFQATEKVLQQHGILHADERRILNESSFNDLLFGLFAAWALKAIGREKYVLFFHPLDDKHTLLSVQPAPYAAIRPSRRDGLYIPDFWSFPTDIRALRGKLLYNAGLASDIHLLNEVEPGRLNTVEDLHTFVIGKTLSDPDRYGWLWGGRAINLQVPPNVFAAMLTADKQTRNLLCESFEQILCLYLGIKLRTSFFSCHLKQQIPTQFSEIDIVLCQVSEQSKNAGLWKPDCSRNLKNEICADRVFVLENSSGVMEQEATSRRGELTDEPESHWHPKIINWLALRQIGFQKVKLHLCSLVPISIDNPALTFALTHDPDISRCHLRGNFLNSIRDKTWTADSLREACDTYCEAARVSASDVINHS